MLNYWFLRIIYNIFCSVSWSQGYIILSHSWLSCLVLSHWMGTPGSCILTNTASFGGGSNISWNREKVNLKGKIYMINMVMLLPLLWLTGGTLLLRVVSQLPPRWSLSAPLQAWPSRGSAPAVRAAFKRRNTIQTFPAFGEHTSPSTE